MVSPILKLYCHRHSPLLRSFTGTLVMSTAKSRNFRRRGAESNDDDSHDTPSTTATTTATTTTKPPSSSSAKPKKPPKLLSFADDEGDDTAAPPSRASAKPYRSSAAAAAAADKPSSRLGKPSSSHKITTLKDRIAHSSSPFVASNVQPLAGTYTKEALRELQKNTRTLVSSSSTSSRPAASGSDPKPSSEPVVVLRGLVKPLGSETEARDSDSGGEQEEVEAKLASVGIAANGKDSVIPDEETIRAIRARRERLRQARPAAPDYISLDGGSNHGAAEGLSDEEPEFRGRIAMFGEKVDGGKKGVFEDVDERRVDVRLKGKGDDDGGYGYDDDEEEEKMWEEEQVRKGLGKRMDEGSGRVGGASNVPVVQVAQQHKFVVPSAGTVYGAAPGLSVSPSIGGAIGVLPALDVVPISQQAEIAKKALQDNVKRLKVWTAFIVAELGT